MDNNFIFSNFFPINKKLNLPVSLTINIIGITIYSEPKENLGLDEKKNIRIARKLSNNKKARDSKSKSIKNAVILRIVNIFYKHLI